MTTQDVTGAVLIEVQAFANALVNRLNSGKVKGFAKNNTPDLVTMASTLAAQINADDAFAEFNSAHPLTQEEVYQWLIGHDVPRDRDADGNDIARGDTIMDALLGILGEQVRPALLQMHDNAMAVIGPYESVFGAISDNWKPVVASAARGGRGGGKKGGPGIGGYSPADPSFANDTAYYPAVPPRVILTDSNYASNYNHMRPEELKQIADRTENFFELVCCLRRMIEPVRADFATRYLGARSNDDAKVFTIRSYENGKAFPQDMPALRNIFSGNSQTQSYVEKFERLFNSNKLLIAAYHAQANDARTYSDHANMLSPVCCRDMLRHAAGIAEEVRERSDLSADVTDKMAIYSQTRYLAYARLGLGFSREYVADTLDYTASYIGNLENVRDEKGYTRTRNRLFNFYEQKQNEWIAEGAAQDETRQPFLDRATFEALPELSHQEIFARWQQDQPELFDAVARNTAFNSKIAADRGYESRRRSDGAGEGTDAADSYVNADTVVAAPVVADASAEKQV